MKLKMMTLINPRKKRRRRRTKRRRTRSTRRTRRRRTRNTKKTPTVRAIELVTSTPMQKPNRYDISVVLRKQLL